MCEIFTLINGIAFASHSHVNEMKHDSNVHRKKSLNTPVLLLDCSLYYSYLFAQITLVLPDFR